ncbi:MAG: hypothetical protein NTV30_09030 [Chloroflexi bacterium]|nr:hypothetical protein [Chloroflexota bacterium]
MTKEINNLPIIIIVSDPWDFVTKNGSGPFRACILTSNKDESDRLRALIKMDIPIIYNNLRYEYLIAESRYYQPAIDEIINGGKIPCSLTVIPYEKATSQSPTDLSWWRGGGNLRATIEIVKTIANKETLAQ